MSDSQAPYLDPDVEQALLEIDFGSGGLPRPRRALTTDTLTPRGPVVGTADIARLLVRAIRRISALRAAYFASVALLAERTSELQAQRRRYEALLGEFRKFRESVMRKAAA